MEVKVIGFKIVAGNVADAFKALKKLDGLEEIQDVQGGLQLLGYHARINQKGDIVKLQCLRYNAANTTTIAETLAPFVDIGAIITVDDGAETTTVPFKAAKGKGKGKNKDPAVDGAGETDAQ